MTFQEALNKLKNLGHYHIDWDKYEHCSSFERMALCAMQDMIRFYYNHGLLDYGWSAKIDTKTKKRAGQCNYGRKTISVSKWLIQLNSLDEVQSTIRHEMAHAIAGGTFNHRNHGWGWKAVAKAIGDDGERCYSRDVVQPKMKYTWKCDSCGMEHHAARVGWKFKENLRQKSCGICYPNTYNPKYRLRLIQNY